MKKLQIEGKCTTKEKAFIAAKLIEMQFEEEDALLASRQCNTVYNAVKFLTQLCEMCNCRFPINLVSFIKLFFDYFSFNMPLSSFFVFVQSLCSISPPLPS